MQQAFVSCQAAHLLSVYCHLVGAVKLGTELSYWEKRSVGDDHDHSKGNQRTFLAYT